MRKFTKEITTLLAAAAMSASTGASASAASEEIYATAGVAIAPTEEYPPVDGGYMPPDDYIKPQTTTVPDTTMIAGTYTTTTAQTTTKLAGTYTTPTTTTTIPPLEPMPPDEYITPTTTEEYPPLAGVPLPPDEYIEDTTEDLPPVAGGTTPPDNYIENTTTTTTEEIPPIMGGFPLPDPDGDINLDGKFSIADVVSMQRWLLGKKDIEVNYWENADLYQDGKIDVFDVCLMREKLIKDKLIDKNYTFLEFQITENVENTDFSQYKSVSGWMGAKEYYGKGYSPVTDSEGNETKPEYYVTYLVSAYPDYADGGQYITRIEITDPTVLVHGITVESPFEEFEAVFKAMDYETYISEHSSHVQYNAKSKDGISYTLYVSSDTKKLTIQADVTNREGIQF